MAHTDASHYLGLILRLLSVVALWPLRDGRLYSVLHHVPYLLAGSAFVFWLGELGTVISVRHDRQQLLGYVGLLSGHSMSLYKWCNLMGKRRQLQQLVDSLSACLQAGVAADRSAELHRFTRATNTRATLMTMFWMGGAMCVILFWSLAPLLDNGKLVELHGIHGNESLYERRYFLPFGEWRFVDTSSSPTYELLYAVWATGSITNGWMHACCDCFYLHVIAFICGQFEFLVATLRLSEQCSDLSACVRHHQQLLR
jgi:hypothetical protein